MLPLKSFQNFNITSNLILENLSFAKIAKFNSNKYFLPVGQLRTGSKFHDLQVLCGAPVY